MRTDDALSVSKRLVLRLLWNVISLAFCACLVSALWFGLESGSIGTPTLLFVAGQASIVLGASLILFVPKTILKLQKWRAWRRRIITDDRPPTPEELEQAFIQAVERLTGRRPNAVDIVHNKHPESYDVTSLFFDRYEHTKGSA